MEGEKETVSMPGLSIDGIHHANNSEEKIVSAVCSQGNHWGDAEFPHHLPRDQGAA
jgi:hypothetical protein